MAAISKEDIDNFWLLLREKGLDNDDAAEMKLVDVVGELLKKQDKMEKEIDGVLKGTAELHKNTTKERDQKESSENELLIELKSILETTNHDQITIKDLYRISKDVLDGTLPKPSLHLTEDEQKIYCGATLKEKVFQYPLQTIEYIRYNVLLAVSNKGSLWFKSFIPTTHLKTLLFVYIYSNLTREVLGSVIPLLMFYLLFFGLVVLSLDMIQMKLSTNFMYDFTSLLQNMQSSNMASTWKWKFVMTSARPYAWFFLASVLISLIYPLCDQNWMATPLLCITSLIFTFFSVRAYGDIMAIREIYFDLLVLLLLCSRILEKYQSAFIENFYTVSVNKYISIDINLSSALQTMSVLVLVFFAVKESLYKEYGFIQVLFPTLVSLVWAQLFIEFFQCTSWYGLAQVGFDWLMTLPALLVLVFYLFQNMVLGFVDTFQNMSLFYQSLVIALLVLCLVNVAKYFTCCITQVKGTLRYVVIFGSVIFLLGIASNRFEQHHNSERKEFTVDTFCSLFEKDSYSVEEKMIRSVDYFGKRISWNGSVVNKHVLRKNNIAWDIISKFPAFLQPFIKCCVGKKTNSYFVSTLEDSCSLKDFNSFTVSFVVNISCNPTSQPQMLTLQSSKKEHFEFYKNLSVNTNGFVSVSFDATFIGQYMLNVNKISSHREILWQPNYDKNSIVKKGLSLILPALKFIFGPIISIHLPGA